jgi:hypothetical protein
VVLRKESAGWVICYFLGVGLGAFTMYLLNLEACGMLLNFFIDCRSILIYF